MVSERWVWQIRQIAQREKNWFFLFIHYLLKLEWFGEYTDLFRLERIIEPHPTVLGELLELHRRTWRGRNVAKPKKRAKKPPENHSRPVRSSIDRDWRGVLRKFWQKFDEHEVEVCRRWSVQRYDWWPYFRHSMANDQKDNMLWTYGDKEAIKPDQSYPIYGMAIESSRSQTLPNQQHQNDMNFFAPIQHSKSFDDNHFNQVRCSSSLNSKTKTDSVMLTVIHPKKIYCTYRVIDWILTTPLTFLILLLAKNVKYKTRRYLGLLYF